MKKYTFKYTSNTQFFITEATESAGYTVPELKELYQDNLLYELEEVAEMEDDEFLAHFGIYIEEN